MKISNSHKKMDVTVKKMEQWGGKLWVIVKLKYSDKFAPSFEDLHRIIQAISYCEDVKYPGGKGRDMVAEFLVDSVYERDFIKLMKKYNIPDRTKQR